MKKENHHTHTTGSDGKLKPEELVRLAIKKKFDVLGITDHYHFPPGFRDWGNDYYLEEHYKELKRLKKKYKDKIKIEVNVEFDWLDGAKYQKWIKKEATKRKYDNRFVSMHFMKDGKTMVPLDWKEEGFLDAVKHFGNVKKLVKWYYSSLRSAIKTGCFDVVSHFDLIKIWNKDHKYFTGGERWYIREVDRTLRLMAEKNVKIDLNASGLRKPCVEQYPSLEIIREARKLGIAFLVGTDAHRTGELEKNLEKLKALSKTL
jgi:histidinol-phosphatase (PHP family)